MKWQQNMKTVDPDSCQWRVPVVTINVLITAYMMFKKGKGLQ